MLSTLNKVYLFWILYNYEADHGDDPVFLNLEFLRKQVAILVFARSHNIVERDIFWSNIIEVSSFYLCSCSKQYLRILCIFVRGDNKSVFVGHKFSIKVLG